VTPQRRPGAPRNRQASRRAQHCGRSSKRAGSSPAPNHQHGSQPPANRRLPLAPVESCCAALAGRQPRKASRPASRRFARRSCAASARTRHPVARRRLAAIPAIAAQLVPGRAALRRKSLPPVASRSASPPGHAGRRHAGNAAAPFAQLAGRIKSTRLRARPEFTVRYRTRNGAIILPLWTASTTSSRSSPMAR
jgi:hypothetical protein